MYKFSSSKELNQMIRKLVQNGWRYKRLRKHARLVAPCGRWSTTVSLTPRSCNAAKHLRWDILKASKVVIFSVKGGL